MVECRCKGGLIKAKALALGTSYTRTGVVIMLQIRTKHKQFIQVCHRGPKVDEARDLDPSLCN